MGDYDVVIKRALRLGSDELFRFLEIPDSDDLDSSVVHEYERRADLLRISKDKSSTHQVEFQTLLDPLMPFRMLEYFAVIIRTEGHNRYGAGFRRWAARRAFAKINLHQTVLHLSEFAGAYQSVRTSNAFGMGTVHRYRNRYLSEVPYYEFRHSNDALDIILSMFSDDIRDHSPEMIVKDTIDAIEEKFGKALTPEKRIALRDLYIISTLRDFSKIVLERYHAMELSIEITDDKNVVRTNVQLINDTQEAARLRKIGRVMNLVQLLTGAPVDDEVTERLHGASFDELEDLNDELAMLGHQQALANFATAQSRFGR